MKYRQRRRVTVFRVVLDTDWGKKNADIVNVTDKGAQLRLEVGNLTPASNVTLHIQGRPHAARVVWNREGYSGVTFAEPLDLQTLATVNRSLKRLPSKGKPAQTKRFLMQ